MLSWSVNPCSRNLRGNSTYHDPDRVKPVRCMNDDALDGLDPAVLQLLMTVRFVDQKGEQFVWGFQE